MSLKMKNIMIIKEREREEKVNNNRIKVIIVNLKTMQFVGDIN